MFRRLKRVAKLRAKMEKAELEKSLEKDQQEDAAARKLLIKQQ